MFNKILIANRGEIACRVIKSARRLGIQTVAVYSAADRDALHVRLADEALPIGPPAAAQSYLVIDKIVDACRTSGAEAVHPGYGFLSENAAFARALDAAGITFIGPNTGAIESMGDKITSKKLARDAGVNTIPGYGEALKDAEQAVMIARDIGYPVMLKASAGGGGKGMRVARNDQQCRDGLERATSEARSSFGDDRVFIEKYIEQPRHIEIQIIADNHGNTLYLGERECSIQRRHQKVIEEAPSPLLDEPTRRAMGEQAVALAKAVAYRSAGTVEFVVDQARNFYFLEMNTRLQVEHPVTELITGLDLVELMLRVAAGETLPFSQDQIRLDGWALEARIYAEDPLRGFLPSTGRLQRYLPAPENANVRVDSGVVEGAEVSMFYDPMIAKLITRGDSREQAIATMGDALNQFYIQGVAHNIGFLAALVSHTRFAEGRLSTDFIAEEFPDGYTPALPERATLLSLVAVAAAAHRCYVERANSTSGQLSGYQRRIAERWVVVIDGADYPVCFAADAGSAFQLSVGDKSFNVDLGDWRLAQPLLTASVNGDTLHIQFERVGNTYRLAHSGHQIDALVLTPRAAEFQRLMPIKTAPDLSRFLLSPMPGLLVKVLVEAGSKVRSGQDLAIVEAMKMENVLRAQQDGEVAAVLAQTGASLAVDQPILEFVDA